MFLTGSSPTLPSSERNALQAGSYEQLVSRVKAEVSRSFAEQVGGKPAEVLGVYPGFVLVLSEEARVTRVLYEDKDGEIRLTEAKQAPTRAYLPEHRNDAARVAALQAVDLMLQGRPSTVEVLEVLTLVDPKGPLSEQSLVAEFADFAESQGSWRKFLRERDQLGEQAPKPVPFEAKYLRVHDGTYLVTEREQFRPLLVSDLQAQMQESAAQITKACEFDARLLPVLEKAKAASNQSDHMVLQQFAEGVAGLVERVMATQERAQALLPRLTEMAALGKLHDELGSALAAQKLALQVVEVLTNRLAGALA